MEKFRLMIITGMSGAGKSQAVQVLEDMGYFCVDNIPPVLIPKFAELCRQGSERMKGVALVVDIRGGEFFSAMNQALKTLDEQEVDYEILFLEATDAALVRRYKETRRSHPLAPHDRILQGIAEERRRLAAIRTVSDYIIDTSEMKPAALKELLKKKFVREDRREGLAITIVSFGFKYGLPMDADIVEDVRFLPNPFYIKEYRNKTGRVPSVAAYIKQFDVTQHYMEKWFALMDFLVPCYEQEGKSQLIIAVGCTGGMHRSVCMAESLYERLRNDGYSVTIEHRDLHKNHVLEDGVGEKDLERK